MPRHKRFHLDAERVELVHNVQEVLDASCYPVKSGYKHHREFLLSRLCDQRVQTGSSCPAPGAPAVAIFLHDLEASVCRKLAQIIELTFDMLVGGADANIDRCLQRRLS